MHDEREKEGWKHGSQSFDGEVDIELCITDPHMLLNLTLERCRTIANKLAVQTINIKITELE